MADLRQAAQQALEALEWASDLNAVAQNHTPLHDTITALRAALAQETQTPCDIAEDGVCEAIDCCRKLQQQALEALDSDHPDIQLRAAVALRAALEQPEQEPVAWANKDDFGKFDMRVRCNTDHYHTEPLWASPPRRETEQEPVARMHADGSGRLISQATYDEAQRQGGAPWSSVRGYTVLLYTHPPRREWVGLTEEEFWSLPEARGWFPGDHYRLTRLTRAIEAKLKEKNHE